MPPILNRRHCSFRSNWELTLAQEPACVTKILDELGGLAMTIFIRSRPEDRSGMRGSHDGRPSLCMLKCAVLSGNAERGAEQRLGRRCTQADDQLRLDHFDLRPK